jgi:hypothetical protein
MPEALTGAGARIGPEDLLIPAETPASAKTHRDPDRPLRSVNRTVTLPTTTGHLRLYPAGTAIPNTSSIDYVTSLTRANNGIVPLNALGELAV